MDNLFVCGVCGHISFGQTPDKCPSCGASKSSFTQNNDVIAPPDKEGHEKHVPVLVVSEKCGLLEGCKDVNIKIGATTHPMQEDHWINWIDVYVNKKFTSRYLMAPGSLMPGVGVHFKDTVSGNIIVVEYCNKHGYWKAEQTL